MVLKRKMTGDGRQPEFLSATIIPGRGMNLFQITAYLPGMGERPILSSPSLAEAADILTGEGADAFGDKSHSFGGAFLIPFANRIRGQVSPDGKTVTTTWHGTALTVPANWRGKTLQVEPHAMHGFIMKARSADVKVTSTADGASVRGVIKPDQFLSPWFSQSQVEITETLTGNSIDLSVTVKDVGHEPEPVGIGWHPYFAIQSGDRSQARLHVPAADVAEVDNHQNEFPTGRLFPATSTKYDFNSPDGAPLKDQFYDDSWVDLKKDSNGKLVSEILDPKGQIGIRVIGLSPEINAIQVYAPPDNAFIALEPQFNWNDPFGAEWQGRDTHMVTLLPGKSTTWHVRVELFALPNQPPD